MRRRKLLSIAVLFGGLFWVVGDLWRRSPRDMEVRIDYGAAAVGLRRAIVRYRGEGATVAWTATFSYATAAPEAQTHRLRLAPGRYRAEVRLEYDGRTGEIDRAIDLVEGDVARVRVEEEGSLHSRGSGSGEGALPPREDQGEGAP